MTLKKPALELHCTHGACPRWQDALQRSDVAMIINNGCNKRGKATCSVPSRDPERRRAGWGAGEDFCMESRAKSMGRDVGREHR